MLQYAALQYTTIRYTNYTTPQLQLQLHYTTTTTTPTPTTTTTTPLQLQLHLRLQLQLQLHYTTRHPAVVVRWPLQPLQPLQKTQLQPPFGPSVDSLCHPWITTTNVSYRFPIFEISATALRGTTGILLLFPLSNSHFLQGYSHTALRSFPSSHWNHWMPTFPRPNQSWAACSWSSPRVRRRCRMPWCHGAIGHREIIKNDSSMIIGHQWENHKSMENHRLSVEKS